MKDLIAIFALLFSFSLLSCGGEGTQKDTPAAPVKKDPTEAPTPNLPVRNFTVEKGLQNPESVTSDGTYYYVSNIGRELKQFRKDQDGYITQLDSAGNVVRRKWASGLDAPKGMVVVGNTLYVADIDRIKGYDLESRRRTSVIDFSKEFDAPPFLNDLAVKNENEIFVSITNFDRVYTVNLTEKTFEPIDVRVPKANGLYWNEEEQLLYTNSYDQYGGFPGQISFAGDSVVYTSFDKASKGQLDGLAYIRGVLVYSDWTQSLLYMYAPTKETGGYYPLTKRLSGPADFYFDESRNEIWAPAMQENKIYVMFAKVRQD
jgi:hypothetical protein